MKGHNYLATCIAAQGWDGETCIAKLRAAVSHRSKIFLFSSVEGGCCLFIVLKWNRGAHGPQMLCLQDSDSDLIQGGGNRDGGRGVFNSWRLVPNHGNIEEH